MSARQADVSGPDDAARARTAAAELERFAGETQIAPREELRGRIMAALAAEPTPAPLTAMATAAREHRGHALLAGLRDLWRVAWSGGRPVAIRLSAAAVVALLLVSVGSAGGLAAVGAWNALHPTVTAPVPTPQRQAPIVVPSASPSTSPSPSPSPVVSPSPAPAASPTSSTAPSPTPPPTPRPTPTPYSSPMWTHHPGSSYWPGSSCGPQPTSGGMC